MIDECREGCKYKADMEQGKFPRRKPVKKYDDQIFEHSSTLNLENTRTQGMKRPGSPGMNDRSQALQRLDLIGRSRSRIKSQINRQNIGPSKLTFKNNENSSHTITSSNILTDVNQLNFNFSQKPSLSKNTSNDVDSLTLKLHNQFNPLAKSDSSKVSDIILSNNKQIIQ